MTNPAYTASLRWLLLLQIAAWILACAPPPEASPPPPPAATVAAGGNQAVDRAALAQLEQEARALAKIDGCTGGAQCRSAPVGAKACGGPRYWLPYCPLTTDVAALMSKLSVLQGAEQQFNRTYGVVSDCSYVVEPGLTVSGGSCRVR